MKHQDIADRAGIPLGDLDDLMEGRATRALADQLGVSMDDVENFIRGNATVPMQQRLGLATLAATEELARARGQDGATCIILGMLFSAK